MISFPRIAALLTLIVLFSLIIAAAILGTQYTGTEITHGNMLAHTHGIVLDKPDRNNVLTFKTDDGQLIYFACTQRCLTELAHIQRHKDERAPTDVYYYKENNTFVAVDVD